MPLEVHNLATYEVDRDTYDRNGGQANQNDPTFSIYSPSPCCEDGYGTG